MAVGRLPVDDATRADHARVADVDHATRRLDVEPDAEPEKEDGRHREDPHRPDGPQPRLAAPETTPQAACDEVQERWIHERRAGEDLPAVEERERDGEGEEREQVDVS